MVILYHKTCNFRHCGQLDPKQQVGHIKRDHTKRPCNARLESKRTAFNCFFTLVRKFACNYVILLIWIRVGQGPTALSGDAGGACLNIFLSSIYSLFLLPLSGRRPDID